MYIYRSIDSTFGEIVSQDVCLYIPRILLLYTGLNFFNQGRQTLYFWTEGIVVRPAIIDFFFEF